MTSDALAADPDRPVPAGSPRRHAGGRLRCAAPSRPARPCCRGGAARLPAASARDRDDAAGKDLERVLAVVRSQAWLVRNVSGEVSAIRLADDPPRPGDVVVVPSDAPICASGVVGVSAGKSATGPLGDVLESGPPDAPRDYVVPLPAHAVAEIVAGDPALGTRQGRRALADALDDAGVADLARDLRQHRRLAELQVTWCGDTDEIGLLIVSDMRHRAAETPAIVMEEEITLQRHQAAVTARMDRILAALRLDSGDLDGEPLRTAARLHDEGKRHPRFQQRMGAGATPLAKPRPGHRPDHGDGWRHEQLSAAFAAADTAGDPLTVSIVAAHHGRGRPLFDRDDAALLDGWAECPPDAEAWVTSLFGPAGSYELLRAQAEHAHHRYRGAVRRGRRPRGNLQYLSRTARWADARSGRRLHQYFCGAGRRRAAQGVQGGRSARAEEIQRRLNRCFPRGGEETLGHLGTTKVTASVATGIEMGPARPPYMAPADAAERIRKRLPLLNEVI